MPTKRNYLIKVIDAKIVDIKRALEAKGIKLESIYEMYKETQEPEKVAAPDASAPPGGATGSVEAGHDKTPAPKTAATPEG